MSTYNYLLNRFKWSRPQGIIFADSPGTLENGFYIPQGSEIPEIPGRLTGNFMILSDHNRSALDFSFDRIEDRKRMLNGTMRSYFIADKLKLSTSWENLPSRVADSPVIWEDSGLQHPFSTQVLHTADGGADGAMLLDWYENNPGPFWVFLSYDKEKSNLKKYQDVVHMYCSSFSYTVQKRGATNFDLWSIQISLEEV